MSSLPGALDALVAAVVRALPGATQHEDGTSVWVVGDGDDLVQVFDGQNFGDLMPDAVTVGYSPARVAADAQVQPRDLSGANRERYDVACIASSWRGDTETSARRARVDQLYELVKAELRRDPSLGRAVTAARCSFVTYDQAQPTQGASCSLEFLVHIDAFS